MELRHLRYFSALAGSLSFTRAAERVHVTQSTLSHQIRQLEEELGTRLFDRVGKRVTLTEAGETFLAYALRALQEIDQGVGALKESGADLAGSVRVGATHSFNLGFIPECVAIFMQRHPTVHMTVQELAADSIVSKVSAGELDLGITYRPSGLSELVFEPLYNEEMVLVVGKNHPLYKRKRVRMVELHRQPIALLPKEFATRAMLEECFVACGAEPLVVAEMNTISPMLSLVARTEIATIVAKSVIPIGSALKAIPIENPTPIRTPGILRRKADRPSPEVRSFSSIVRKLGFNSRLQKID
ncbi:LysR substrate-binding domain-containing protein [Polaromonas sp.]|jgi:LysR family cyn operon transcriptional activator|uniref:LysR substrate-binding domain-containing protein n=1 Tax=Polaromonas sp. TaxID=1869339 RepID=UPI001E112858|nr:LysR substrate-binding domain-containing protein [Polaromonas sp.]MBT9475248.1 LysR family transcriptional regulator [Polaromonas sp.]